MYTDDVIIYTSAPTHEELQKNLQSCVDNVTIGITWIG